MSRKSTHRFFRRTPQYGFIQLTVEVLSSVLQEDGISEDGKNIPAYFTYTVLVVHVVSNSVVTAVEVCVETVVSITVVSTICVDVTVSVSVGCVILRRSLDGSMYVALATYGGPAFVIVFSTFLVTSRG